MKYRSWHQHSFGFLSDGSRIMLVTVRDGYPGRRNFPAVLVCRQDGLYRLWRNGRSQLLAPGYTWPTATKSKWKAEESLRAFVPKAWGSQWGSGCVIQPIPDRILLASTSNLARLLIAWFYNTERVFSARIGRMDRQLRPMELLPVTPLWHPVAVTVVPNTDVVVRALHSGVLLQRLKRGLERIYVSEMAWVRAPRIEVTLRALAHRFPERLVLVKAETYGLLSSALKVKRVRACEYQFVGYQLQGQYEDDFGYDKFDNPSALVGMAQLRVGDIPRGSRMLWLHELPVGFEQWGELNVDGINELQNQAAERRVAQDKQASDALARTFQADRDTKAAQALELSEPSQ